MGRLFHPDSPLMRFLWKAVDLIALNILWLVCCIPIVTIGPATTALYYVARGIAKGEWPPVIKTFFKAFAGNFKQSLLVFLILLFPVCLALIYVYYTISGALDAFLWLKVFCFVAIVLICFVCSYVYPLLAHFDNTVRNTLKNAILLPIANPFLAIAVTALNLLPIILFLSNIELFIYCSYFWLVIGGSLTAFVNTKVLSRLFLRFAPESHTA